MAFPGHRGRARADAPSQTEGRPAFQSFFDRADLREERRRGRRRTLIVSLAIHVTALLVLVLWSFWDVDELWTPSVKVKVFSRSAAPAEAAPPRAPHE